MSYKQGVRIEIGPEATAREIEWHITTAKMLLRYEGPLGEIRKLLNAIGAKLRLVEEYGSEGFEAKAELEKLNAIKSKLEAAQHELEATFARYGEAKEVAAAEAEKLQQELAGIEAQIKEHEAALGSIEPGRGHVASEDLTQKERAEKEAAAAVEKAAAAGDKPIRNAHLAGKTHPATGVPFDAEGYPEFKAAGLVNKEVKIKYTGSRTRDFKAANAEAGFAKTPEGYTWHHHQDGTTMQLVPREIHAKTGHTGGFASGE